MGLWFHCERAASQDKYRVVAWMLCPAPEPISLMKTPIGITLIIAGAVLILAPVVSDQLHEARFAQLIARPDSPVRLDNPLSELYSFGCWLTGSAMIGMAVRFSLCSRKLESHVSGASQPA